MRTLVVCAAVVALLGGCVGVVPKVPSTYARSKQAAIVGGIVAAAGLVILAGVAAKADDDFDVPVAAVLVLPGLVVPGVMGLGAGLMGMAEHEPEPSPAELEARERAKAELAAARTRQREQAWALTKDAARAARAEDCTAVTALDLRVHEIDAEFYGTVFLRDVAIKRCLDQAAR